jgi:lipopolysaccharide/colanic/teichoic acid biosynthesis glycosyltransferase
VIDMQRVLDILFSSIALIILSPLFLLITFILKFTGEGEVFFLQDRVGKNGQLFKLYKFATMLKNSPNIASGTITLKGDPRILPMGKFLRKTKINELPQLINILMGDMSIVGPRPQAQRCFYAFPKEFQEMIIRARPGLSGIGSIIFRGEEDLLAEHEASVDFYDAVIAPYKGEVESWYISNQNLFTYFTVIGATVWVVLFSSSKIVWHVFKDLPAPPESLKRSLNYSE